MTRIMLFTDHPKRWSEFAKILSGTGENRIEWIGSRKDLLTAVIESAPKLVIIDETVEETPALALARDVVMKNAMVYIAVVDSRAATDFHEAAEGLGILAQLPPLPGPREAESLITSLKEMPM